MSFQRGGVAIPLTASTSRSLADDADYPLAQCLRFLQDVLTADLEDRFQAELARCSFTIPENSDGYIAPSLVPLNLDTWGPEAHLVFPVLSLHRESESYFEKTQNRSASLSQWTLRYLLPSGLNFPQSVALTPLTRAVAKSIRHALERGNHSAVNGGASWMTGTGIDILKVLDAKFLSFQIRDTELLFPALEMRFEVEERDEPLASEYEILETIDGYYYSVLDGYEDALIVQTLTDNLYDP